MGNGKTQQWGVSQMSTGRMNEPRQARLVEFDIGEWRVEPDCNRISHRRLGIERRLEPRLMRLLGLLAANAGRTLSRERLGGELWPRVIVTENSLTRAVSALRKSLVVDGCGGGVSIETVPKKGYRLVLAETEGKAGKRAGARLRGLRWPAFAAPALALAVVAGSWLGNGEDAPPAALPANSIADFGREFVPVSSTGLADARREAPVLSANGDRYAFISRGAQDAMASTIWLGDLRGGDPVAVYSSALPLANLVWSPAGNALLFARRGALTAGGLYGGAGAAQLLQFDLDTWTVSELKPAPEASHPPPPAEIDLT